MKAILIAAALAVGTTAFATVPSQAATVTITTRDDGWHDNGNHYGWYKHKKNRFTGDRRDCEVYKKVVWRDGERIVRTVRRECAPNLQRVCPYADL